MAKRHLGLAKAGKAKQQKGSSDSTANAGHAGHNSPAPRTDGNGTKQYAEGDGTAAVSAAGPLEEVSLQLSADIDANDAMGQLCVLWLNFIESDNRNELMANAVVHECDRLLRKSSQAAETPVDDEKIFIDADFYSIYAGALASLAFFHASDPAAVRDFFKEAAERIDTGKRLFPGAVSLLLADARILLTKIPLTEISQLDAHSTVGTDHGDVSLLLDECLVKWEAAERVAQENKLWEVYNRENAEFLNALDDLLKIVATFGEETVDAEDSDDTEPPLAVQLGKKHPLYKIRQNSRYGAWWREHTIEFLELLEKNIALLEKVANLPSNGAEQPLQTADEEQRTNLVMLKKQLSQRVGNSFLAEAEGPAEIFAFLAYESEGQDELDGLSLEKARTMCKTFYSQALEYLRAAQDDEEPDSWASVAEAIILLGNMYDVGDEEQERLYKEAEQILVRANNVTNGKYEAILQNLIQE